MVVKRKKGLVILFLFSLIVVFMVSFSSQVFSQVTAPLPDPVITSVSPDPVTNTIGASHWKQELKN